MQKAPSGDPWRGFFVSKDSDTVSSMITKLPARIQVHELVSSRYGLGYAPPETLDEGLPRPLSWDERVSGSDVVKTQEGLTLKLQSSAQQTPPQPGWVLVLTVGSAEAGYDWTLYGLPRKH